MCILSAVHPALFATPTRGALADSRISRSTEDIRHAAKDLARTLQNAPSRDVVRLAKRLIEQGDRPLSYELLAAHPAALESLRAKDVEALGRGMEHWGSVDQFACFVAGQAWRRGQIADALVLRWARSRDRWWRRAAVVSTVPLNAKSRGGEGDAQRTLKICKVVLADRDQMVVKALSWALRELSKRDQRAVERFVATHDDALASIVRREVRNKLETGLKNPKR